MFTIDSNEDQSLPPPHTHTHTHACIGAHTPMQNTKHKNPSRAKQSSLRDSFLQQSRSQGSSLPPRSTIRVIYNASNLPVVACPLFILPIFFSLPFPSSFFLLPFLSFPSFPSTLFAPYARKIQEPHRLPLCGVGGGRGGGESARGKTERGGWLAGWWLAWPGLAWSGWQVTRETRRDEKSLPPFDGMHSIIQFTVANDGV